MVKTIEGKVNNLFDYSMNLVVCPVGLNGYNQKGISGYIGHNYPHIEKELLKYVAYRQKHNKGLVFGTNQYVPIDIWSLIMCDTLKNETISCYDTKYCYVVNMFCQTKNSEGFNVDMKAIKTAFIDVKTKAEKGNHKNIAILYSRREYGGISIQEVVTIAEKIFNNSNLNVTVIQCD